MANFYYNIESTESYTSQWKRYIQEHEYLNDITSSIYGMNNNIDSAINLHSKEYSNVIRNSTEQQVSAIRESASIVSATLENGFKLTASKIEGGFNQIYDKLNQEFGNVTNQLKDINFEINSLVDIVDYRMSMLLEQQNINNILTENIALLLRIPDFEKERQYYIEQGLKFLKNAQIDEDLYKDALDNFIQAEAKNSTDYFVLHRIGMIYQYAPQLLDITKAEDYFRRAAKYAFTETHPQSVKLLNILSGNISKKLNEQSTPENEIKKVAASSYFQAGISCYIQGKFSEAVECTDKAFNLCPTMLDAGFSNAKALAVTGNIQKCLEVLEKVVRADRNYAISTTKDLDLMNQSEILKFLDKLRTETVQNAKNLIDQCKKNKIIDEILSNKIINTAEKLTSYNSYIESLQAIDLILLKRNWKLIDTPQDRDLNLNFIEYIEFQNKWYQNLIKA